MNKWRIIIALIILAALLIYPFRERIKEAFSGEQTGAAIIQTTENR